ncbi:MAG: hypothetical protein BIFFINMI_03141 [Phycisphaerae bacterium]|nr:hypothetical protein [Phycisphaerae bacterium]
MSSGLQQPERPPRLRAPGAWARRLMLAAMVAVVAAMGCSDPHTRYKVLSFFFDGVPDPDAPPGTGPEGTGETASAAANVKPQFIHAPYRDRNCLPCHEVATPQTGLTANMTICGKCHAVYGQFGAAEWVHGPTALGLCGLCHDPHKSEYPHIIKQAQPTLCLNCHTDPKLLGEPYHELAALGKAVCSDCHDPHMAGNRLLLVDAGSYQRRKPDLKLASTHPPFRDRKCQMCHSGDSNAVRPNLVQEACRTCHKNIREPSGPNEKVHPALAQDKCLNCHEPHQSTRPHLIRPTAQEICMTCHKVEQISGPAHPPVVRVDCLLCHQGHESTRAHLLRRGVPIAGEKVPPVEWLEEPGRPPANLETTPPTTQPTTAEDDAAPAPGTGPTPAGPQP